MILICRVHGEGYAVEAVAANDASEARGMIGFTGGP